MADAHRPTHVGACRVLRLHRGRQGGAARGRTGRSGVSGTDGSVESSGASCGRQRSQSGVLHLSVPRRGREGATRARRSALRLGRRRRSAPHNGHRRGRPQGQLPALSSPAGREPAHLHDGHGAHLQGEVQEQGEGEGAGRRGHVGLGHVRASSAQAQVQGRGGGGRTVGLPSDRAGRPREPSDAGHPQVAGQRRPQRQGGRVGSAPALRNRPGNERIRARRTGRSAEPLASHAGLRLASRPFPVVCRHAFDQPHVEGANHTQAGGRRPGAGRAGRAPGRPQQRHRTRRQAPLAERRETRQRVPHDLQRPPVHRGRGRAGAGRGVVPRSANQPDRHRAVGRARDAEGRRQAVRLHRCPRGPGGRRGHRRQAGEARRRLPRDRAGPSGVAVPRRAAGRGDRRLRDGASDEAPVAALAGRPRRDVRARTATGVRPDARGRRQHLHAHRRRIRPGQARPDDRRDDCRRGEAGGCLPCRRPGDSRCRA